jgi:hypothetical protein
MRGSAGSILGPLLFLVYINDLPNISKTLSTINFADDTNLFAQGSDLTALQNQVNQEMPKLQEWLRSNRLSLNIGKTHIMIFNPKKQKQPNQITIKIDNQTLETVSKTKFLGVIIDNSLSWKPHTLYIAQKMAKSIGILSMSRKVLSPPTLLQLYHSFIGPYINYCNLAWGNAPSSTLWPVFKNQKVAIRIIGNLPWKSSTIPFCKKNIILRLPDLYHHSLGLFMFKYNRALLPNIFSNFFTTNQECHRYPTRQANKLRTPLVKTSSASKFVKKTGVEYWNVLENSITSTLQIGAFKKHLKLYILQNY